MIHVIVGLSNPRHGHDNEPRFLGVCDLATEASVPACVAAVGSPRKCDRPIPSSALHRPLLKASLLYKLMCLQQTRAAAPAKNPLLAARRGWADRVTQLLLHAASKEPGLARDTALSDAFRALAQMPLPPIGCLSGIAGRGWDHSAGFGDPSHNAQRKLNDVCLLLSEGQTMHEACALAGLCETDLNIKDGGVDKWGFAWQFCLLKLNYDNSPARAWLAHCPALGITRKLAGFGGKHPRKGSPEHAAEYNPPDCFIATVERALEGELAGEKRGGAKEEVAPAPASGSEGEGDSVSFGPGSDKRKKAKVAPSSLKPRVVPHVWIRVG